MGGLVSYDRVADNYVRRIFHELEHKPFDPRSWIASPTPCATGELESASGMQCHHFKCCNPE
jgi:hypothetical protein